MMTDDSITSSYSPFFEQSLWLSFISSS